MQPIRELYDRIIAFPTDEPLEWRNEVWLKEWAWCDALFMAPPVLALLYSATGEAKYLDFMDERWWKTTNYLDDPLEHLFYRDSRFFSQTEKKIFWGRGNGLGNGWTSEGFEIPPFELPNSLRVRTAVREDGRSAGFSAGRGWLLAVGFADP